MAEELYTWVPFYTELADKLLPYKNNRAVLIDKLQAAYESINMKLPKLDDGGIPVSYTHLDVYKRQTQGCVFT